MIDIVELGIVRDIEVHDREVMITVTPTYSGCPAMDMIESEIIRVLGEAGLTARIQTVLSPPWSTEDLSLEARNKLRDYGIAPPHLEEDALISMPTRLPCPFCSSTKTELRSEFGSTACKALYFCKECLQPFEYFKRI